eukprot:TRINITY_DN30029_c2_g2_i1.p1 TRINITY_DN30029_c2_g2~~TRINITY_DN30029_c2_g2_i1.p1  ORF type:complete len:608 (+),score=86.77 TRINITY_DN30029_c2_g2_i1:139-1962(+)
MDQRSISLGRGHAGLSQPRHQSPPLVRQTLQPASRSSSRGSVGKPSQVYAATAYSSSPAPHSALSALSPSLWSVSGSGGYSGSPVAPAQVELRPGGSGYGSPPPSMNGRLPFRQYSAVQGRPSIPDSWGGQIRTSSANSTGLRTSSPGARFNWDPLQTVRQERQPQYTQHLRVPPPLACNSTEIPRTPERPPEAEVSSDETPPKSEMPLGRLSPGFRNGYHQGRHTLHPRAYTPKGAPAAPARYFQDKELASTQVTRRSMRTQRQAQEQRNPNIMTNPWQVLSKRASSPPQERSPPRPLLPTKAVFAQAHPKPEPIPTAEEAEASTPHSASVIAADGRLFTRSAVDPSPEAEPLEPLKEFGITSPRIGACGAQQSTEELPGPLRHALQFIRCLPALPKTSLDGARPFLPECDKHRKPTLVLDLDETLAHCCRSSRAEVPDTATSIPDLVVQFDDGAGTGRVFFRPYVHFFLEAAAKAFEVVVFTASQQSYADQVIDALDPTRSYIHHRLYRQHCTELRGAFFKELVLLGRPLAKCLLVDNSPISVACNADHGVLIKSWYGDKQDQELLYLLDLLGDMNLSTANGGEFPRYLSRRYGLREYFEALRSQ